MLRDLRSSALAVVLCAVLASACGDSDPTGGGGAGEGGETPAGGSDEGGGGASASAPSLAIVEAETGDAADRPMFFEPLAIVVADAAPDEELTIVVTIGTYASRATFVAAADGTIDTREDAP